MKLNERGFCIFYDWVESLEYLPREEVGEIIFALRDYYTDGTDPTERFEGATRAVVSMMLMQIKRAAKRAEEKKPSEETKTEAQTEAETEAETETEKNKETKTNLTPAGEGVTGGTSETEKKSAEFIEPSLDLIKAYASANGISRSEAEEFYDYYTARGWQMGAQKMREWHSALKTWVRRGKSNMPRFGRGYAAREKPRYGDFDPDEAFQRALERSYREDD